MWDWLLSWRCSLPTTRQKPPNQSPLLTTAFQNDAASRPNCFSFSSAAAMLISWLNRRRRRYLLLILCSPLLVPLLFAACPIICAVELCSLISRRRRRKAAPGRGRSGDGGGDEVGLLQRYLEDQLMLVWGNDDLGEGGGVDVECFDRAGAVLQ